MIPALWCLSVIALALTLAHERGRELDVTTDVLAPESPSPRKELS